MTKNILYNLLNDHVPENAVHYAYDLWATHQFSFKVTKKRNSKYGDYRYDPKTGIHKISVNGDLNKFAFLVTFLHEVAHLVTCKVSGRRVDPHGKEWKRNFQLLMLPMLNNLVFPDDILGVLKPHMENPKATSSADHRLSACLRKYDEEKGLVHLGEISPGTIFKLNTRIFKKETKRRTRILCEEIKSGKKYLISQIALVERLEPQLKE